MSDLVGNPEDRFSRVAALIKYTVMTIVFFFFLFVCFFFFFFFFFFSYAKTK